MHGCQRGPLAALGPSGCTQRENRCVGRAARARPRAAVSVGACPGFALVPLAVSSYPNHGNAATETAGNNIPQACEVFYWLIIKM